MRRKKIHVLLCLSRLGIGGIQTFVLLHAHYLKSQGINVSVFSYYPELSERKNFEQLDADIPVYTLSRNKYAIILINHVRNIIKKIFGSKYDLKEYLTRRYFERLVIRKSVSLIHSNIHITDKFGIFIKKKYGVPFMVSSHGSYNGEIDSETLRLMDELSANVDAFVYTSAKNIENFKKNSIELERMEFIPNGYLRKDLGETPRKDRLIFGIMSRGVEEKGWMELRQAIDLLNLKGLNFELKIVADGQLPKDLFSEVKNVDFIGETLEYELILNQCDICLHPSFLREESMPFAIITFLALGKPVIASDIGEIRWMMTFEDELAGELIDLDGKTGRVNPNQLASQMELYINNLERINRKSEIANQAFSKFDISTTGRKYIDLYYEIIDQ